MLILGDSQLSIFLIFPSFALGKSGLAAIAAGSLHFVLRLASCPWEPFSGINDFEGYLAGLTGCVWSADEEKKDQNC